MSDHPEPATVLVQWDLSDYSRHYANDERSATITSLLVGFWLAGAAGVSAYEFAEYPLAGALLIGAIWSFAKPSIARRIWLKRLPAYYFAPVYVLPQPRGRSL